MLLSSCIHFFRRRVPVSYLFYFTLLLFLPFSLSLVQCTINADNTVPSICYVIQAKLTLFSDTILDTTSIFQINNIIEQTITNGDLISVDNRLLDISWNSFNDNSPISSSSGTGGGEGGGGGSDPNDVSRAEGWFGLGWPWWYYALIGVGAALLLLVLGFTIIIYMKNNRNNTTNQPPPIAIHSNEDDDDDDDDDDNEKWLNASSSSSSSNHFGNTHTYVDPVSYVSPFGNQLPLPNIDEPIEEEDDEIEIESEVENNDGVVQQSTRSVGSGGNSNSNAFGLFQSAVSKFSGNVNNDNVFGGSDSGSRTSNKSGGGSRRSNASGSGSASKSGSRVSNSGSRGSHRNDVDDDEEQNINNTNNNTSSSYTDYFENNNNDDAGIIEQKQQDPDQSSYEDVEEEYEIEYISERQLTASGRFDGYEDNGSSHDGSSNDKENNDHWAGDEDEDEVFPLPILAHNAQQEGHTTSSNSFDSLRKKWET